MNKKWSGVERMLLLSVGFTISLLAMRIIYSGQLTFIFFVWNLFLAIIPLVISRNLYKCSKLNAKAILLLLCWLLFLPNAPYIITDIFHFYERANVPKWFDLLLVTSAAWNGLIIGIVSLLQVEEFLQKHLATIKVNVIIILSIAGCAFGIYLGRFLRFNSWDVFTDTNKLLRTLGYQFLYPFQHTKTWAFTVLFSAMLCLVYYTMKRLSSLMKSTL